MPATITIAQMLDISPNARLKFEFEGNRFEYIPADLKALTAEVLCTEWADGPRSASPLHQKDDAGLRQSVAMLLANRFRKVYGDKTEQAEIIERAKSAIAAGGESPDAF